MAARPTPAAVSIPRFLLPQLTWRAPHLRPAATLPSSASARKQVRRQHRDDNNGRQIEQYHTSAVAHRHQQQQQALQEAADWNLLAAVVKEQQRSESSAQSKLTKSIYKALCASLQPAETSTAPHASPLFAPVPRNSVAARSSAVPLTASVLQQRRSFHATAARKRDHHFDTLKFVQRLKDEGFSEAQATAMMRVLSDVIEESIQNLTRTMVLREEAERATYTQKVDFTKLRSELLSSDNTEASLTRASHERMANDLAKINSRLRDEIGRTQASVRLDLNLEKGRIREEANVQELKIKETEARIEQEVAGLRERVEGVKFGTLQWLMGVCTGTAAIILGAWRLLM